MSGEDKKEPTMHVRELRDEFSTKEELVSILLQKDEDSLYEELFLRTSEPGRIYEAKLSSLGKSIFEYKYLSIIKSNVCPKWHTLRETYDNAVVLCGAILQLISQDVPTNVGLVLAALVVKIGLNKICQG